MARVVRSLVVVLTSRLLFSFVSNLCIRLPEVASTKILLALWMFILVLFVDIWLCVKRRIRKYVQNEQILNSLLSAGKRTLHI